MNLREKISKRLFKKTDVPVVVYLSVIIAMVVTWRVREKYEIAGEFFVELFGVAFTLFIIDILLVRTKTKRWKVVRDDIDYLIARGVNRLRDGLAIRAFLFDPNFEATLPVSEQRAKYLTELEQLSTEELPSFLNEADLFTADGYAFFKERASDFWDIINMKYSEFLSPVLVSQLINLHVHLKDVCAHIHQYRKSERNAEDALAFKRTAREGVSFSLKQVIALVNKLKEEGYSESARKEATE